MFGELEIYTDKGDKVIVSFNGGQMKIRRPDQKPYEAKKIGSSDPLWQRIYTASYEIANEIQNRL